jgi:hypothetical protein
MSPGATAAPGADVRLTNDDPAKAGSGYVSAYTLATGRPYTDEVLTDCSNSRGRQNEPSVAVDPRNPQVIVGSSNDYCGVFTTDNQATGPVWLGYYRSENAGASFVSSLVPGYPGDTSPYAANAHVRTSGSGDPVLAWDGQGRLFAGSESSGDPAGSPKTFGDVWVATYENSGGGALNDGKRFVRTVTVASGSAAPNILGVFHDKTAIEVDRTGGACDGTVYFAWARFTGGSGSGFNSSVYVVRSTDHGAHFSAPVKITQTVHDIQFPDISVTGNGHVYITYRRFADVRSHEARDAVMYNASTDCGATFSAPRLVTAFEPYDATDLDSAGGLSGDCGDDPFDCQSGYTFFRRTTQVRSTADQTDRGHDWIYVLYDPSKPGTETPSGTTYGSIASGDLPVKYHRNIGSQSAVYFLRLDGASGRVVAGPRPIDNQAVGHQLFPDISADQGSLHALWWDSRNDPCFSPSRPVGNCANKSTVASLDVYATASTDAGGHWAAATRVTDVTSNPNWEQFGTRRTPFAGDYLYISSVGAFSYGVWTDYRDVRPGVDLREGGDDDADGADVYQCRVVNPDGSVGGDTCPRAGGLDQNIYGNEMP